MVIIRNRVFLLTLKLNNYTTLSSTYINTFKYFARDLKCEGKTRKKRKRKTSIIFNYRLTRAMLEKSCKTILSVTKHKVWFPSVVSVTLPYSLFLLKKNDDKKTNKKHLLKWTFHPSHWLSEPLSNFYHIPITVPLVLVSVQSRLSGMMFCMSLERLSTTTLKSHFYSSKLQLETN